MSNLQHCRTFADGRDTSIILDLGCRTSRTLQGARKYQMFYAKHTRSQIWDCCRSELNSTQYTVYAFKRKMCLVIN